MKARHIISVIVLTLFVLVIAACGTATPTPVAKPTAVPSPTIPPTVPPTVAPTSTPVPPTPTVPPTATPVPPKATTKQQVNVRQGPSADFAIAGKMPINTSAVVLGKNEDGKWLQLAFPDATHPAWVSTAFVTVTGTLDQLPVVAVAPPPTATVGPTSAVTKTVAAITPTRIVPAAKGILGFIAFDVGQNSYTLNNLFVNPRSFSGFKLMGTMPFDLAQPSRALPFAWSPDGSRVVYVFGQSGAQNILRMAKLGTDIDIALVSNPGISSPTWSPNSKTVAYVGVGGGPAAIFTINPDGGPAQKFFPRDANRPPEDFRGISWGSAYMLAASNETGAYEIWRINSDGSGAMQLTTDKRDNSAPAWSPDGKEFAYSSKQVDGTYQIMVADPDGRNARKITNAGNNFSPSWSSDGNWIAFTSTRGGRMDVYIADKSGGNVQVLTDKYPAESQLPGSWR